MTTKILAGCRPLAKKLAEPFSDVPRCRLWPAIFLLVSVAQAEPFTAGAAGTAPLVNLYDTGAPLPETATLVLVLAQPAGAGTVTLTLTTSDLDMAGEAGLTINGGTVRTFPAARMVENDLDLNGGADMPYTLSIPASEFRAGDNTLLFTHYSTMGYRIQAVSGLFPGLATPPPPTEGQCFSDPAILGTDARCADHVAQFIKNNWAPGWSGWTPRLPDRVKRRTSTTPDRIYWGWKSPETLAIHTNWAPWQALDPLTAANAIRQGLVNAADVPPTDCDKAFLWSDSANATLRLCAEVRMASSTATVAPFYSGKATTTAVVGSAPRGASCAAWAYEGPVTNTTTMHWFRGPAPSTGTVGYVRCVDWSK